MAQQTDMIDDLKLFEFFNQLLEEGQIYIFENSDSENINISKEIFQILKEGYYHRLFEEIGIDLNGSYPESENCRLSIKQIFQILWEISQPGKSLIICHKIKVKLLNAIWSRFIRKAILLLRNKDPRDKGKYKSDLGVTSLTDYFNEFSNFEELLFGADERQREHILHVFRVFLLGVFLVMNKEQYNFSVKVDMGYENEDEFYGFEAIENPYCSILDSTEIHEFKLEDSEKFAIWTLIALTHDLGYPLEKLDKINQRVLNIMTFFGSSNFYGLRYNLPLQGQFLNDYILRFISSKLVFDESNELFYPQIQAKYYTKFSNAFEKLSHGIISCILLMKNLVYFLESDFSFPETKVVLKKEEDARQFSIRRDILRAIASHDCDDIYHIRVNNFPFLLKICDELQEWDRPIARDRFLPEIGSIVQIQNFTTNTVEFSIEIKQPSTDYVDFVKKKVERFIRLFRSGVDSEKRPFSFSMTLKKIPEEKNDGVTSEETEVANSDVNSDAPGENSASNEDAPSANEVIISSENFKKELHNSIEFCLTFPPIPQPFPEGELYEPPKLSMKTADGKFGEDVLELLLDIN